MDSGGWNDKLIRAKTAWAQSGRVPSDKGRAVPAAAERLPAGQHEVSNWPVLDLGVQPAIPLNRWRLTIDGLVGRPCGWDWGDYYALPRFHDRSDIHCVTSWSRYDNEWEGVSARTILEHCRPLPQARYVMFHSYDGYSTNVPLTRFMAPDALLADQWRGKPITTEHGGPVRVVIPQLYFWKSAKWLKRIEFMADDKPGFWENRGYHMEGDPWKEQRYDTD